MGCPASGATPDSSDGFLAEPAYPGSSRPPIESCCSDSPTTLIAWCRADGTVRIWSLSHLRQIAQVRTDASLFCGAFDPHTGCLLAGGAAGVLAVTINRSGASG